MELMDLLDAEGNPTGRTLRRGRPVPPGLYYNYVQIFVCNEHGQLLVQKRSWKKRTQPGVWAVTCGVVSAGESSRDTAHRELLEEVGLDIPAEAFRSLGRIRMPRAFLDLWAGYTETPVSQMQLQPEEVSAVRYVSARAFIDIAAPDRGRKHPVYYNTLLNYLRDEGLLTEPATGSGEGNGND